MFHYQQVPAVNIVPDEMYTDDAYTHLLALLEHCQSVEFHSNFSIPSLLTPSVRTEI